MRRLKSIFDHSARRLVNEPFASSYVSTTLAMEQLEDCLTDQQTVVNSEAEFFLHFRSESDGRSQCSCIALTDAEHWLIELQTG